MFVLGTAGHIDHGKSVLVQALTGIDPDRLEEEKARGMTIDLGFAWMKLPSGREVGIVDVPGHERFIKNMLAGVGSIDLAMLVMAATEGVMPQTREHLAILDLLEVKRGIVVLTKADLVDGEMLELVKMEAEELLASTSLSESPLVAVSAVTGQGMPELVSQIDVLLAETEPRRDIGHPRLPVDRVFTITGAGSVVTGTLIDGSLSVGDSVEILPEGIKSRVRGLQTHKTKEEKAVPGSRVAINLVGVAHEQIRRGSVVTSPGWLKSTSLITMKLRMLGDIPRHLRHDTEVSLFVGADETTAKVRLLQADGLKPGASGWAQLVLAKEVVAVRGDHVIVRSSMETLGGGMIIGTGGRRLPRKWPDIIENLEARRQDSPAEVILALIGARGRVEFTALAAEAAVSREEVEGILSELSERGSIVILTEGKQRLIIAQTAWNNIGQALTKALAEYHRIYPAREGMPSGEMTSKLALGSFANAAVKNMLEAGLIGQTGGVWHVPGYGVRLSETQKKAVTEFLAQLKTNPYAPPHDTKLEPDLLGMLVSRGEVIRVGPIVFNAEAYRDMVSGVTAHLKAHGKITLADVRDIFGNSRKYAQALLEHMDGAKITRRVGDERVLY
ncbi:selenocysteine-specific translation elongation factor [Chloroflexota bacterium]